MFNLFALLHWLPQAKSISLSLSLSLSLSRIRRHILRVMVSLSPTVVHQALFQSQETGLRRFGQKSIVEWSGACIFAHRGTRAVMVRRVPWRAVPCCRYSQSEIRFNLLAVCKDHREALAASVADMEAAVAATRASVRLALYCQCRPFSTVLYCSVLFCAVLCCSSLLFLLVSTSLLFSALLYSSVLHCTAPLYRCVTLSVANCSVLLSTPQEGDSATVGAQLAALEQARMQLSDENEKFRRYTVRACVCVYGGVVATVRRHRPIRCACVSQVENARRKHNYVPFIHQLLKVRVATGNRVVSARCRVDTLCC
jgi:hypothetical protein